MSETTVFERMLKAFGDAGKKNEFNIIAAALQAGISPAYVEEYMPPSLDMGQLAEQFAAILDGVPKETLEKFAAGDISAEEMRGFRLGTRNDAIMTDILQQLDDMRRAIDDFSPIPTLTQMDERIQVLSQQIEEQFAAKAERLEVLEGMAEDTGAIERAVAKAIKAVSMGTDAAAQTDADAQSRADESAEETATIEDMQAQEASEAKSAQAHAPAETENKEEKEAKKNRLFSYFRRLNPNRIEKDEQKKKAATLEFIKEIDDEEKLQATLEACKSGVPRDDLKLIIEPNDSVKRIRTMTEIYLLLFSEPSAACA